MSYYRAKIEDISDVLVRQIFDDLCRCVRWPIGEKYELKAYEWLMVFFQQRKGSEITQKLFPAPSPLTTRISKLAGTDVYVFCSELCRERHEGLEFHETGTVLSLVKKLYASPKGRLGKVEKRLF